MRIIKLTIEYDGTDFKGWQIQSGKHRTVQGDLTKALYKIFKDKIRVVGSGRTDSGVHAFGQVAHFKTDSRMTTKEIVQALNANLPEDIAVLDAKVAKNSFHAQFNAKSKVYRYTILNRNVRCAQLRNFCLFYPHDLNVDIMRNESKALVGKKDFRSFQATDLKRDHSNTIRRIKSIKITKKSGFITIDIEANGFLYKMVRNIVGTLLFVGSGRLPKGSVKRILAQKDRKSAPKTAPAHGLCLMKVKY